jgi:hypothetical protein
LAKKVRTPTPPAPRKVQAPKKRTGPRHPAAAQPRPRLPLFAAAGAVVVLAAIVVGKWNPAFAAAACLLFGAADAFQLSVQALGFVTIPSEFFVMLPYILTVAALAGLVGRTRMPRKLGIPYSSSAEV